MKARVIHIVFVLVGLLVSALFTNSCKPKKQEIPPFITVHLDVKDENDLPVDTAVAYLYTSKEAFDLAYQNSLNLIYNSNDAVLTTTIINGKLDLKDLPSNVKYWILVHDASESFVDNLGSPIPNFVIHKDNSEAYYTIDAFQNGTEIMANIKLVPVNALIRMSVSTGTPPNIIFGNGTPQPINPNGYIEVRKGSLGYQARTNQCVWTGAVEAVGGQVVSANLAACSFIEYTFNTSVNNFSDDEEFISIYIGQNASSLTRVAVLKRTELSKTVVLANSGAYTYFARHSTSKCVWEGPVATITTLQNCE